MSRWRNGNGGASGINTAGSWLVTHLHGSGISFRGCGRGRGGSWVNFISFKQTNWIDAWINLRELYDRTRNRCVDGISAWLGRKRGDARATWGGGGRVVAVPRIATRAPVAGVAVAVNIMVLTTGEGKTRGKKRFRSCNNIRRYPCAVWMACVLRCTVEFVSTVVYTVGREKNPFVSGDASAAKRALNRSPATTTAGCRVCRAMPFCVAFSC